MCIYGYLLNENHLKNKPIFFTPGASQFQKQNVTFFYILVTFTNNIFLTNDNKAFHAGTNTKTSFTKNNLVHNIFEFMVLFYTLDMHFV